jgi:hypothetical protein
VRRLVVEMPSGDAPRTVSPVRPNASVRFHLPRTGPTTRTLSDPGPATARPERTTQT